MERETDDDSDREGEFYDLEGDTRDEDESDTADCPSCGASIYEEAERCPRCGNWVVARSASGTPRWIVWTAALSVLVILVFWLGLPGTLWRALTGR